MSRYFLVAPSSFSSSPLGSLPFCFPPSSTGFPASLQLPSVSLRRPLISMLGRGPNPLPMEALEAKKGPTHHPFRGCPKLRVQWDTKNNTYPFVGSPIKRRRPSQCRWMIFCLLHKLTMGFAVIGVINGVLMQAFFYNKPSRSGAATPASLKFAVDSIRFPSNLVPP